jgi:signal transduction histidine kinase
MRPEILEEHGLVDALEAYFYEYSRNTAIAVDFSHKGFDRRLPDEIEVTAYRIIQEALTNVARYAEVDRVRVRLDLDDRRLQIEIEDRGKGFDLEHTEKSSFGVSGMQDRAYLVGGELSIHSSPGFGTQISCQIPLPED